MVTSAVVTSQRVPAAVRHALNLESGLNDGLALPFVLFFIVLASPSGNSGTEAAKLLGEAAFGALIGVVLGQAGGRLTHHLPGGGIVRRYEGIYALGLGLLAYGIADVTFGNGLIAAFVCGISLAVAEHDIADDFVVFSENVSSILQVLTFFAFGALIVATGYHGSIPLLVAFIAFAILIARPVAILLAFIRVDLPKAHRGFIAWFGPKGVASMLFADLVLTSDVGEAHTIFEVAAFVILASIVIHGATDTLGAKWIERRVGATNSGSSSSPRGTPPRSARPSSSALQASPGGRARRRRDASRPSRASRIAEPIRRPASFLAFRARRRMSPTQSPRLASGNSRPVERLSFSMPAPASANRSRVRTSCRVPLGGQMIRASRATAAKTDQTMPAGPAASAQEPGGC